MPLKATYVASDVIFPVVVAICLAECNTCVVWLLFEVGALSRSNVLHQEPLGLQHCLWVIRLPHGEVVCQLDPETLVPAVFRQQDK